jgi:hypothetical protein
MFVWLIYLTMGSFCEKQLILILLHVEERLYWSTQKKNFTRQLVKYTLCSTVILPIISEMKYIEEQTERQTQSYHYVFINIVTCLSDYRRGLDWWLDLLLTYTLTTGHYT